MNTNFHGSYDSKDVTFLLDPITVTKANFQSLLNNLPNAQREIIWGDYLFKSLYLDMFQSAVERNANRVAQDVLNVAGSIAAGKSGDIVIASLVRAGTPIGVLIHRALKLMGRTSYHYSVSATRKRGSDPSALDYILTQHEAESIAFVDGWTGKGYIAGELSASIQGYNQSRGVNVDGSLHVLADLAGAAAVANSGDDYLIPSAMLRSTVCGLIGPSMLSPNPEEASSPDACFFYENNREQDQSRYFVDAISDKMIEIFAMHMGRRYKPEVRFHNDEKRLTEESSNAFVDQMIGKYGLTDRNKVKPGICEANRALLSRQVRLKLLLGRNADWHDVMNLHYLASKSGAEIEEDVDMPYNAAVIARA